MSTDAATQALTPRKSKKGKDAESYQERLYTASQWVLIWHRFRRHRLAMIGGVVLLIMYTLALLAPFASPYGPNKKFNDALNQRPTAVRFVDLDGNFSLRPFVYGVTRETDRRTLERIYTPDPTQKYYVKFFAQGDPYKLLGFIPMSTHLFLAESPGRIFLLGTDQLGQDLFSRILHAAQISLSIGLVGIAFSFVLGCLIGGISGYYGGTVDMLIQRIIEFLISIPTLPLWMGLSAALPRDWSQIKVYFAITVILALAGWTGLARVVRGKILSTRNETFVKAAELAGASQARILLKHLLPSFTSYLIVNVTMSIPYMILGETALSFLGLGLRPPVVSWGVLLNAAQNVRTVAQYPWMLTPVIFVVLTVLAFNFLGDGLRDAADPYKEF
jgi:peptide/nickel transport system permease protein